MQPTSKQTGSGGSAVGPVRLADGLGWTSSVLGAPMILAPRRLLRTIGVRDDRQAVRWTVVVGLREHLATLNIIANRQRRIGMWSRAVGDTMDLVLLVGAYRHKREDGTRLAVAGGIVGAIFAADLVTAIALTAADRATVPAGSGSTGAGADHDTTRGHERVRTAVTIRGSEEEVRRAFLEYPWSAFDARAVLAAGEVRFTAAPGDRGTELHLDHEPKAPGGAAGAMAAKLLGRAGDQTINDELRRFKAQLETGEPVRSDKSPDGPSSARQIWHKRRPAQPVGKGA